jgi:uncharacterized membrane protein YccC
LIRAAEEQQLPILMLPMQQVRAALSRRYTTLGRYLTSKGRLISLASKVLAYQPYKLNLGFY